MLYERRWLLLMVCHTLSKWREYPLSCTFPGCVSRFATAFVVSQTDYYPSLREKLAFTISCWPYVRPLQRVLSSGLTLWAQYRSHSPTGYGITNDQGGCKRWFGDVWQPKGCPGFVWQGAATGVQAYGRGEFPLFIRLKVSLFLTHSVTGLRTQIHSHPQIHRSRRRHPRRRTNRPPGWGTREVPESIC